MKRSVFSFLAILLCVVLCLSTTASAKTYNLGETDMSVSVDDTTWYVFTRENIMNNPELDELGIDYQTMYSILHNNEAYMDAILYYEDGQYIELIVRKRTLDTGITNLSGCDDEFVLELAKELAKKQGAETYSVYKSQYKFARSEYTDTNYGYYICEYVTIVNGDNYTLTFQTTSQFTQWEHEEIKRIVDSVVFDVDTAMEEAQAATMIQSILEKGCYGAIIGAVAGGVTCAIVIVINKKRKKSKAVDNAVAVESVESE